ncbi:MAG: hypothetical protein V3V15_06320 [Sphingorhabdus sp.]
MRIFILLTCLPLALATSGCVSIVKDVVTAPIKVVSKTADVLTTSQSEADEKRGRKLRKKEENLGKLSRKRDKAQRKCDNGNQDACEDVYRLDSEVEAEQDRPV